MDPTEGHKRFAADARAMHTALVAEGFTDDQAVTLLCQLIANDQAANRRRPDPAARSRMVEKLLAEKPSAARSPADDRAADLWNPPAPDLGAPAHD
ncbi:hypothetical protein MED01_004276 [Micromonospora sp. MED01]|uniref:hypothetical protein n=1 Tax=Micromonospora alfalfae TaxID=2911212 RepID=UPI001EE969D4|nr:hypothetical protein [Micromonospora alfalfae]MCG5460850.1 hypothetical protein [Micromonospora alfalfae]